MNKYNIISNDSYAAVGVKAILDELLMNKMNSAFDYINILIIVDSSLCDVYQIYWSLDKEKRYVLISSEHVFQMLSPMQFFDFIDISMSFFSISNKLHRLINNLQSSSVIGYG
ncbi:hypothetical protein ACEXT2_001369 [Salmonella enterica]